MLPSSSLGDRLAVGLRTLTPPTKVRILVPQPNALSELICPMLIIQQYPRKCRGSNLPAALELNRKPHLVFPQQPRLCPNLPSDDQE